MSLSPLVTINIVTWNNENDISQCLKSISKQDYDNYNVIVVDNASTDNTVKIVKESFPFVVEAILGSFFVGISKKSTACWLKLCLRLHFRRN